MDLYHQAFRGWVLQFGDVEKLNRLYCVDHRSLDDEHALRIVATCGTDGVDKHLLIFEDTVGESCLVDIAVVIIRVHHQGALGIRTGATDPGSFMPAKSR